jgi:hypothetical protein
MELPIAGTGSYQPLARCYNINGVGGEGALQYCCDNTSAAACCSGSGSFAIPIGHIILRYSESSTEVASTASPYTVITESSGSPLSLTSIIPSSYPTNSQQSLTYSSTSSSSTTPSPTATSNPSKKFLAIGLGVGIPFGLALLCLLTFLGIELRRYNNLHSLKLGNVSIAQDKAGVADIVPERQSQPEGVYELSQGRL